MKICSFVLTQSTNVTDRQMHRQTPHDSIGRAYAQHLAAKMQNSHLHRVCLIIRHQTASDIAVTLALNQCNPTRHIRYDQCGNQTGGLHRRPSTQQQTNVARLRTSRVNPRRGGGSRERKHIEHTLGGGRGDRRTNKRTNERTDRETDRWTSPLRKAPLWRGLTKRFITGAVLRVHSFHVFK